MAIVGDAESRTVFIDGAVLEPDASQRIVNHSPDGFAWGYCGSGPAQLALAILLHLKGEDYATEHYQAFKREVISTFPMHEDFTLQHAEIDKWIEAHK